MRICVIEQATGKVVNIVELGLQPPSPNLVEDTAPPPGLAYVADPVAQIGWSYGNGVFTGPPPEPMPTPPPFSPTPRQWFERLTPATQGAITKAAASDVTGGLLLWLLKAAGTPAIDVTAAET